MVTREKEGRFVTTRGLVGMVTEAMSVRVGEEERERGCGQEAGVERGAAMGEKKIFEHIRDCLWLSAHVLRVARPDMDVNIKLSIASVCELISFALPLAARNGFSGLWGSACSREDMGAQMLSAGWCSSDVQRSSERFSTLQTLLFVSRMSRFSLVRRDHGLSRCEPSRCFYFQSEPGAFRRRHREEGCGCEDLSPAAEGVLDALKLGALPLLRFRKCGAGIDSLSVEIVDSSAETPYVAISHVWADGLGNPVKNALPKCQLAQISEFSTNLGIAAVKSEETLPSTPETSSPLLIWLDSLCCPVEPNGKALALAQMRRTYEEASYVLVLDASIQCYDSRKIHVVEALMRIFTSTWMQRLWTLQEGALARKLWFQFKDGPICHEKLMFQLSRLTVFGADPRYMPLVAQIWWESQSLNVFRGSFPSTSTTEESTRTTSVPISGASSVGDALQNLDTGLLHRSTSVAADEPLCIGTLLNLPIKKIVQPIEEKKAPIKETASPGKETAPPEKKIAREPTLAEVRMGRVWTLIAVKYEGLPQRILTFREPKLVAKGLRWAPKSFLSVCPSGSSTDRIVSWEDKSLEIPMKAGLLVNSVDYRLEFRNHGIERIRNA